jgi:butyryl-CoA dehydrogenase/acyl-CoA dehydrogenase
MSLILSRRDLNFVLYEWLKAEELTQIPRFSDHSRETFDAALDTCEKIATDLFAPHNKKSDAQEPHFDGETVTIIPEVKTALKAFCEAGLMAAGQDYEYGGMQLPVTLEKAAFAYFKAANVGTSSYPFLTIGNANLLLTHGTPAQIDTFVRPELEGRFFGTMCLSEPQAGSSLSDITTRADYEGESPLGQQYRLRGNKMWISAGEHELREHRPPGAGQDPGPGRQADPGREGHLAVHRAEVPGQRGRLAGRAQRRGAGRPEPQDGLPRHHQLPAELRRRHEVPPEWQGRRDRLSGRRAHKGLACMFHMMNEARIGVGLGAVALGYTGYLHALDYARNRPQGRPVARRARIRRARRSSSSNTPTCAHAAGAEELRRRRLALNLYCARLVDDEHAAKAAGEAERQRDCAAAGYPHADRQELAVAVVPGSQQPGHPGAWRLRLHARLQRRAVLSRQPPEPIHEGTHGIQGLDLLGRKVVMQDGAAFQLLGKRVQALPAGAGHG